MKKNPLDFLNDLKNWQKFKKELCQNCIGLCCYMPVEITNHDLLRMGIFTEFDLEHCNEFELAKIAKKNPGIDRYTASTKKYTLSQKPNGSCYFLNSEGQCTQYELRPDTCRNHPQIGPKPGHCAYYPK